jgi:hypothetical protein
MMDNPIEEFAKVWADYARNNVVFIDEVNEAARGPHRLNDVARGAIVWEHSRYVDSIRRYLNEDQIYDIESKLKALRKGIFSMGETPVLERISLHTAIDGRGSAGRQITIGASLRQFGVNFVQDFSCRAVRVISKTRLMFPML